jgi:hypothetical protein
MLQERKTKFHQYNGKTDIVQLLLQQDEDRQKNENVSIIYILQITFLKTNI